MIYFDNAATTFPKPEVMYVANDYALRYLAFNAGRGSYNESKEAHLYIEKCRDYLCEKANGKSLIFTSSATQSLNTIINGLDFSEGDIVYYSPYDHNAIVRTLYEISKEKKFEIKMMDLRDDLSIDLDKLRFNCIKDQPKAIFCTHVSNVTGYILPIDRIGEISKENHSIFVVDGAQAFGLVQVDLQKNNIDYYVFAGHKTLYGPFGIAGIIAKKQSMNLSVRYYGGTGTDSLNVYMPEEEPIKYEPSSPNIVAIYALLKSSEWVFNHDIYGHENELVNYALDQLKTIDDIIIYKGHFEKYTGIISFNINGFTSQEISKILDEDYKIKVRSDYHCCPSIHTYIDSKKYLGTIRISFSYFSTRDEIDQLVQALEEIVLG